MLRKLVDEVKSQQRRQIVHIHLFEGRSHFERGFGLSFAGDFFLRLLVRFLLAENGSVYIVFSRSETNSDALSSTALSIPARAATSMPKLLLAPPLVILRKNTMPSGNSLTENL